VLAADRALERDNALEQFPLSLARNVPQILLPSALCPLPF
jgi:hypothetical protein